MPNDSVKLALFDTFKIEKKLKSIYSGVNWLLILSHCHGDGVVDTWAGRRGDYHHDLDS